MLVRDCMTTQPISVRPDSDPLAALGLCKSAHIRRLPVVNAEDQVIGIVTRNMLEMFLSRAPSPGVMKRQHSIAQVLVEPVITVSPEYPLEEAARLMVFNKIGSLPVVEDGKLVGIITETDIFKQFVEILGGQAEAIRVTVVIPDAPGALAKVVNAVAALRGNIRSIILMSGANPATQSATLWIEGVDRAMLSEAVQNLTDVRLIQMWSTPGAE